MYTVEIYKTDRRVKSGERLILAKDYATDNKSMLEKSVRDHLGKGERYEIHATMVTKTNILSGQQYQERYDTAYSCSPSSETYWSM